jgi:hypothetical protein
MFIVVYHSIAPKEFAHVIHLLKVNNQIRLIALIIIVVVLIISISLSMILSNLFSIACFFIYSDDRLSSKAFVNIFLLYLCLKILLMSIFYNIPMPDLIFGIKFSDILSMICIYIFLVCYTQKKIKSLAMGIIMVISAILLKVIFKAV